METKKLSPVISQWPKKYCVCDSPYNPDMEYVQCEKCQKWYHNDCAIKESDDLSNFVCSACIKKDQLNKKKKKWDIIQIRSSIKILILFENYFIPINRFFYGYFARKETIPVSYWMILNLLNKFQSSL